MKTFFYKKASLPLIVLGLLCPLNYSHAGLGDLLIGGTVGYMIGKSGDNKTSPEMNGSEASPEMEVLFKAASSEDWDLVKALVKSGVDVNTRFNDSTLLHYAAGLGSMEVAELLIDNGAYVNVADYLGYTPLHYAARHGSVEIFKLLIDNGANVHARDEYGMTPFHYAAGFGPVENIALLIEKGADLNARDNNRETPLKIAKRYSNDDVLPFLHSAGAKE